MTPPSQNYRLIGLTQGQFAKVDAADFVWLSQWKWYAQWNVGKRQFVAARRTSTTDGSKLIYMHRQILDPAKGLFPDHINGDSLDNRRSNLRAATASQNSMNRRVPSNNTTGFRGVFKTAKNGRYTASIGVRRKKICLGTFATAEEASAVYEAKAKEMFGEFQRERSYQ